MHPVKKSKKPIIVPADVWEDLPLTPRVRRAFEETGNVLIVDPALFKTSG